MKLMNWIIIAAVGLIVTVGVAAAGAAYHYGFIFNPSPTEPPIESSVYEFTMKYIDGKDVKMENYKGKVIMVVNTASRCGLTPQYEGLQKMYDKYKDRGFTILGFPANNFMGQEPGTEAEIKEFCTLNYKVSFPMFSKISVKGEDQHPFYTFLTHKDSNPGFDGDISWNFEKFLINKNGKVIARFKPRTLPDAEEVVIELEKALAE